MTTTERKAVHTPTPYAASELTQHEYDLLVRDAMRWRTLGDELVAALRNIVERDLRFYDGFVDTGCIPSASIGEARAILQKVSP